MRDVHSTLNEENTAIRFFLLPVIVIVLMLSVAAMASAGTPASTGATGSVDTGPEYGVVFISSAEDRAPGSGRTSASIAQQYQDGLASGASWNRWPLYWNSIEYWPDQFNWPTQDETILDDIAHGLKTNAILLGTPGFYQTDSDVRVSRPSRPRMSQLSLDAAERATPEGLFEPIFNDGTDQPGSGKTPNPANRWAVFVWRAVNRYKPGGEIAQMHNWPDGAGITHWEMWNEPDYDSFWDGSLEDYARLLKVGYLVAKQADPDAVVLFGGLANNTKLNFYRDVLEVLSKDPMAGANGFFHDILATHSYFHAWKSWYHVYRAVGAMKAYGLDKAVWLNESGVPAWNDYPGPVWDPNSALRATTDEQADYVIQSAFYALFAGADAIFTSSFMMAAATSRPARTSRRITASCVMRMASIRANRARVMPMDYLVILLT